MKRLFGILILFVLLALAATPALAQGPGRGDHVCFGGDTLVAATDTPRDVFLFGCGARIQSGARVQRDVVSFGGNIVLEEGTQVGRDLVLFGGNVDISGHVQRRVVVIGGNVTLQAGSVVDGDIQSFGNINRRPGATVRGRVNTGSGFNFGGFGGYGPFAPFGGGGFFGVIAGMIWGLIRALLYAIAFAVLGALTVVFLPAQTRQVGDVAERSALPSLGVGCLTLIVGISLYLLLILVSVILMITIIGIPVGILLLVAPPVALAAAWLFGWIAVGRLVGEKLIEGVKARETWRVPVIAVIVGILILTLLGAIPFFGWLISIFVGLLGIGAVVLSWFGTRPYPPASRAQYAIAPVAPSVPPAPPAAVEPVPPAPPAPPSSPAPGEPNPPAPGESAA